MKAFIYCAALYCEDCGNKIKAELDRDHETPQTPEDESTYDSDQYPKGPYNDGGGEADCPQHCDNCHTYLENPLTPDGILYVIEALAEYVTDSNGNENVLDEWADNIKNYSLDPTQNFIVQAFERIRYFEDVLEQQNK